MSTLRSSLFSFYNRAQTILAPGLQNAQFVYRDMLEASITPSVKWLDIGCGRRLFPTWMPRTHEAQDGIKETVHGIFGIDPDLASLRENQFVRFRTVADSGALPFASNSFNLLTANMVIEHVANPEALLTEAHRVLRPNGIILFHTPNLLSYATLLAHLVPENVKVGLIAYLEGRKAEDVFPTLYRMNTPRRIQILAKAAGFDVIDLKCVESSAQAVMLGPLVAFELLWIRLLRWSPLRSFRSNLIVRLRKHA